ncbi:MAG: hypothetical protein LUF33_02835 [Clostridiales bacterium]|nr:hypothetical protein [Clostridiales bacterium]
MDNKDSILEEMRKVDEQEKDKKVKVKTGNAVWIRSAIISIALILIVLGGIYFAAKGFGVS